MNNMRPTIWLAALLVIPLGINKAEEQDSVKLIVVDRSMSKDSLYACHIHIPKGVPIEMAALVMYDRNKAKVGEALLGTMATLDGQRQALFYLNHELVRFSTVEVHIYPPKDDRHDQFKFVVGDRPAIKKEGDKRIEVRIE